MNYFLGKFLKAVIGINEVLAQSRTGERTPGETGGTYALPNPLRTESFTELIDRIAGYLIIIAAPIATIMILLAAFQFLTAGDNPEKVKTGKQMILWTAVGYGIILISKGITLIIVQLLGAR